MVILTKNKEALLDMMETLGKFLKERNLKLSTEKSKVLVFNRKGKGKDNKWKWKDKEIEKVKGFKYLGYVFNKDGNNMDHTLEN